MMASERQGPPPAITGQKQERGRFRKGESGNLAGKPKGTRHRATMLAEALMAGDLDGIVRAVIKRAKSGDMGAARIVLDRLAPIRRGRPVEIDLPKIETVADVLAAQAVVIGAVGQGALTPEEGQLVGGLIDAKRRAIETFEHEKRLLALEEKLKK